jgi:hypothetical protein
MVQAKKCSLLRCQYLSNSSLYAMTSRVNRFSAIFSALFVSALAARADLSLVVRDFQFTITPRERQAFIRFAGSEVLLPVHGSNYHFVPDATRRIAAVSYHVVSNYDSVAIAAEVDGCLLLLPDIWPEICTQAHEQGIVPSKNFSHEYIRAVEMKGDSLRCTYSAHGLEGEFRCKFVVDIAASRDGISLQIRKDT